jgi:hypothetical protein
VLCCGVVWCGVQLESEADDLLVTYHDPLCAFGAAFSALHAIAQHNLTVADADYQVAVSGCGLECGPAVQVDARSRKVFGGALEAAFKLGEDVCTDGQLLVGEAMHKRLLASEFGTRRLLHFERKVCEEWSGGGGAESGLVYYIVSAAPAQLQAVLQLCATFKPPTPTPYPMALSPKHSAAHSASDPQKVQVQVEVEGEGEVEAEAKAGAEHPPVSWSPARQFEWYLSQRSNALAAASAGAGASAGAAPALQQAVAGIDARIHARFTAPAFAVLFSASFEHVMSDAAKALELFEAMQGLVRDVVQRKHNGEVTEQWNLCAFRDAPSAVKGTHGSCVCWRDTVCVCVCEGRSGTHNKAAHSFFFVLDLCWICAVVLLL